MERIYLNCGNVCVIIGVVIVIWDYLYVGLVRFFEGEDKGNNWEVWGWLWDVLEKYGYFEVRIRKLS